MEQVNCFIWDISPVIFKLGPLKFRWYGFMFALVFVIGYKLILWQFSRAGFSKELSMRFLIYSFVGMLVGAYFGHRIFYEPETFFANPFASLQIWRGISGLSSHGATFGLLIAFYIFHKKTKIRYMELLDRSTFGVALGATFVRIGNLFNSEIVGRQTDVAWAFCFPRYDKGELVPRHPSQIYETFIGLLMLGFLYLVDKKAGQEKRPLGLMFATYMLVYFTLRFFVEFFKEYQVPSLEASLTMGQYLSIPFVLTGIATLIWSFKTRQPASLPVKKGKKAQ